MTISTTSHARWTLTAAVAALSLLTSCGGQPEKKPTTPAIRNYSAQCIASQVTIKTQDIFGQESGETIGTYVMGDIVAAPLSRIRGAHNARMIADMANSSVGVYGYTNADVANDVVLVRVGKRNDKHCALDTTAVSPTDTLFTYRRSEDGKLFRTRTTVHHGRLTAPAPSGSGLFDAKGHLRGMAVGDTVFASGKAIDSLARHQVSVHRKLSELRRMTGKTYISANRVASIMFQTTMGSFAIRLFDETPEYRDNFIQLVSDGYYDSLLVHRVLPNFLIQTGAADTKHAQPGEAVGWQGPGYMLPMTSCAPHFHVRGAIASSKTLQEHNPENKSDGGQFYVVTGHIYTDVELDKIEKDYKKKFSATQRKTYKTVGGAPHLDDDYVVFGEVVSGMDVVDRIAAVETDGEDRPLKDIRVLKVKIVKK